MTTITPARLYLAAIVAETAWTNALNATFGTRALISRYQPEGQGAPGSELRMAYDAKRRADDAYLAALRAPAEA